MAPRRVASDSDLEMLTQNSATWPAGPRAAGAARHLVRNACRAAEVSDVLCDTALLLTSELISNASIHARSPVRLTITITRTQLRVDVGDDNPDHPLSRSADPDAVSGRGIALVEACAHRWGVTDQPVGKTVWFELELAAQMR